MIANAKKDALRELEKRIQSHKDWWLFPAQDSIQGFMGTDPVFFVGDQPSKSEWPPEHPNRKAFYGLLQKIGVTNAHLTDLYKKRGECGALKAGLPADFNEHVSLFREELEILQPTRIVALGDLAHQLLKEHVSECKPALTKIWHFSYAVRCGDLSQYEADMRRAVGRLPDIGMILPTVTRTRVEYSVPEIPTGALRRRWTLRADNHGHHHGIVRLSECPLYLELLWRSTSVDSTQRVGVFRLDLTSLLRDGYIRPEPAHSHGLDVRLRIVRADDGRFYVQTNQGGPRILLSNESRNSA